MSTVDRCIAVAAHGRRCQQSTYRGGPYCWHHTQSRKVPAPSRTRSPQRPPAATAQWKDWQGDVAIDRPLERNVFNGGFAEMTEFWKRHGLKL